MSVNLIMGGTAPLTMSSREVAELTSKRHDHVIRDIEKILDENEIDRPKFGGVYLDAKGEQRKCYNLPCDLTYTLIAGYRSDLRLKIVRRWMELEAATIAPPETPEQLALRALAGLQSVVEKQKVQLALVQPKADALDRIAGLEGTFNGTEAAKELQVGPQTLFRWMDTNEWTYKRAGSANRQAYQKRINAGDLTHKTTIIVRPDGTEKAADQVRITAQGLVKLARLVPGAHLRTGDEGEAA
ncbi:phage regulatory protein/antirepressor Ant [Gluconobacter sp. R75690]|uniref:phage antirepressor KilAC domain-containing protein n=1 Tax=unclassified Gluconobacter TaxID=2644261 RepID=UPI00188B41C7|nr:MULTISPECIES: phage regulatory protein/antirepressor Ant [unclassified Gluconobacter]MBF0851020.1 phage regulatory protein/antirepressor Ant [Gluconobacter sp. R75690]MBF0879712.1 phage regulatory protein/antirepressor Ant [Gluconobacter sp. R75828]